MMRVLTLATILGTISSSVLLYGVFREVRMVLAILNGGCLP